MKRPDLTYLTQSNLKLIQTDNVLSVRDKDDCLVAYALNCEESVKYMKSISKLQSLVQLAEVLFDITFKNPESLIHQSVAKVLEDLRIDEKNTSTVIEISKDAEKFKHKKNDENFDNPISNLNKEYK